MKPVDVESNTYFDSSRETNNEDLKFKIYDIVTIAKYKNIFKIVLVDSFSRTLLRF